MKNKIRLAKKIAESGIASRREAEVLIQAGRVSVDGELVETPVFFVDDQNEILVDGKKISKKSKEVRIWKFYKPRGVITTKKDPKNRKTVFDFFKNSENFKNFGENAERLLYIGRLDYNSEGILLFTNNGDVARKMELPSTALQRTYRVRIFGDLPKTAIEELKNGITINGICYGKVEITEERGKSGKFSKNSWLTIKIFEGKNREIRKIMEHYGCVVNRLIRISYGPFKLENLVQGEIKLASQGEMKIFDSIFNG